jgi:hypothetical protein
MACRATPFDFRIIKTIDEGKGFGHGLTLVRGGCF